MAGTLFVVATPIGHLEDITARALRILREVSVVAAEDTRRSGNLLRHFGIPTRLVSLHEHNERERSAQLLEQLAGGESVAMVSDAGTPGISDPGAELVRLARSRGFRIEAVPGPSAIAAAVSVSGLKEGSFAFLGFPPFRSKDRAAWLEKAARLHHDVALVFFEAPHRIRRTLADLKFLNDQSILLFRELTKMHEETLTGSPSALAARLTTAQGEFTIVVPAAQPTEQKEFTPSKTDVLELLGQITESHHSSKRAAAREVGKRFGLSTRTVYELAKKSSM
jgi:16S rRNA (cytidine1402-2'-O)-methyltransferase